MAIMDKVKTKRTQQTTNLKGRRVRLRLGGLPTPVVTRLKRRVKLVETELKEELKGVKVQNQKLADELASLQEQVLKTSSAKNALPQPHAKAHETSNDSKATDNAEITQILDRLSQRSEGWRENLLKDTETLSEVARRLNLKSQTLHARMRKKRLFGVQDHGHGYRLPKWQFDSREEYGVLKGLHEVLEALSQTNPMAPLILLEWFESPNANLGNITPVEALKQGLIDEVVRVASSANPD